LLAGVAATITPRSEGGQTVSCERSGVQETTSTRAGRLAFKRGRDKNASAASPAHDRL